MTAGFDRYHRTFTENKPIIFRGHAVNLVERRRGGSYREKFRRRIVMRG